MEAKGFSKITGIGAYLPEQVITSEELMREAQCRKFGVPETFINRALGIKRRRFADASESFADLAINASREAIKDAAIDPLDIDMVLFCGIDRDCPEPSTAHTIQKELGANNADCLDISNACLGALNGLSVANAYLGTGSAENILVCTGEKPSLIALDIIRQLKETTDKATFRRLMGALTVGDGGGAFIVTPKDNNDGCLYFNFTSEGLYAELCYYKYTPSGIEGAMHMEEISNRGLYLHKNQILNTYKKLNWKPQVIEKLYCHQVGSGPHNKFASLATQPLFKTPAIYEEYGNLTSATFPVNMSLHRPSKGDRALLLGAGSGLSICQIGIQF